MTPTPCRIAFVALLSVLISLLPLDARAQVDRPPDDKTLSPYFLVEGGDPAIDRLPLKDTSVEVSISGVIADVTVRQLYENHGTRPIHARYVFPASIRAAVYGMTMTVGEVRIVATIKERERAAKEFEAAKRQGKSASLLEQSRPNVFTMQVANVLPGDTIAVELRYTELLVPTDGTYEFMYPTVVGPRYSERRGQEALPGDDFVRTPYTRQGEAPLSTFHLAGTVSTGVPVHQLDSPSHEVVIRPVGATRADIVLPDTERLSGNRDFILRYRLAGQAIASGLLLYEGQDENFFLLMAEPPGAIVPDAVPAREYVFVVDVSGSMHGFPLETAKALMRDLVGGLRASDAFNVLVFADGSETFAPVSVAATPANLQRAQQFIGRKQGGGGTRLLASLQTAMNLPRQPGVSRSVVLLTDGFVEAEADVFEYVRTQLDRANVFAFGIGTSVNRFLIEGVARAGLGEPFVVTAPGEAADAASRFRRYIASPVLTGIGVTFRGFDVYGVEPATVPDLFASRPIVVFGKWKGAAAGAIEITGTTGHGPYGMTVPVTSAQAGERHGALRHLWARARVADLSDFAPRVPEEARIAEITALGLTYGLLTRYTSFVAVQEMVRRTDGRAEEVDQPLPLPAGVSHVAVGITSGSEPHILWAVALIVTVFMCARLRVGRQGRPGAVR